MENNALSSHNECRDNIVDASEQLEKLNSMIADPALLINESFETIEKQISWRRSALISEINSYCDKLTEQNRTNRTQCLISNKTEDIVMRIDEMKKELAQQSNQFSTGVNEMRIDFIQNTVLYIKKKAKQLIHDYKESLLQEQTFVYQDFLIEDFVGKIIDDKQVSVRLD